MGFADLVFKSDENPEDKKAEAALEKEYDRIIKVLKGNDVNPVDLVVLATGIIKGDKDFSRYVLQHLLGGKLVPIGGEKE